MLVNTCCPTFAFLSITMLIIAVCIGLFIAELIVGFNKQGNLMEVTSTALHDMGANYGPGVKEG